MVVDCYRCYTAIALIDHESGAFQDMQAIPTGEIKLSKGRVIEISIIVNLALDGHNIFVTGQAGIGKSEVVRHIIRNSQAVNQKVVVVCSTGIACYVYSQELLQLYIRGTGCRRQIFHGGKYLIEQLEIL